MRKYFLPVLAAFLLLAGCNSTYTSKKKGYYKLDLPEKHEYAKFERPGFPYSFEYPTYGNIIQDSTYFDNSPENPYWIKVE